MNGPAHGKELPTPESFVGDLAVRLKGTSKCIRADFYLCWPLVAEALRAGYSMADVHAALVSRGLWSGHYATFRRYVRACRRKAPDSAARQPPHRPTKQPTQLRSNPLLERRERAEFDYSKMSEEVKRLIEPAGDE